MANTYTLIASSTVGSGGASTIDFTSIPSTYTDLCLVVSGRAANAATTNSIWIQFNATGSSYTEIELTGSGSAASSGKNASAVKSYVGDIPAATATASTFGNAQIYIPNYAGSTNKSFTADTVQENNTTAAYANLTANLWSNTAAITQVSVLLTSSTFVQYSTAYLYGVKNA